MPCKNNDQMEYLNIDTESLTSIATNNTSLQPGFILFLGFVLFSLTRSEILRVITSRHEKKAEAKRLTSTQ